MMDKHKEHKDHKHREKDVPPQKGSDINTELNLSDADLEKKMENEKVSEERRTEERRVKYRRDSDRISDEQKKTAMEENQKLKNEMDILNDTMLRRQADFENYKKRMIKQQGEWKKMSIRDFAQDIILINDDLLLAIEASESIAAAGSSEETHKTFVQGVSMISNRIEETLKKYGIEEIDSLNREFDPNFHEAVEIEPDGDVEHDTVTRVYHKGFKIDDLVVRSAKVRVTKPKREAVQVKSDDDDAGDAGGEDSIH